jgi:hypothetical protein
MPAGHYVVLCGFDAAANRYLLHDPAAARAGPATLCAIQVRALAWLVGCVGATFCYLVKHMSRAGRKAAHLRAAERAFKPSGCPQVEAARKAFGTDEDLLMVSLPAAACSVQATPLVCF